jgi:hypothetical protein
MWLTENSDIHLEEWEISASNIDRVAQSMWPTEFSVAYTCFGPASRLAFLTVQKSLSAFA